MTVHADDDGNNGNGGDNNGDSGGNMTPLPPAVTMSMTMTAVIRGRQLDDGNLTTTMGQRQCTLSMMAMMGTAETVTAMATTMAAAMATAMAMETATAMMPPPPLTATMFMKTMAAFRGWQLDNGNWTTTMGRRQ
jgi:hypothetical protein